MYGQMKKYKESPEHTAPPILLSSLPYRIDLRGLMTYAEKKGVRVIDLTEKEKAAFIRE